MKIIGVIPARYDSKRLPGKPLAEISGVPMVVYVYRKVVKSDLLDHVTVATDDQRILKACSKYNVPVIMTSKKHRSGTDRIYEASKQINADIIINIQCDEPMIEDSVIQALVQPLVKLKQDDIGVSSLYTTVNNIKDYKDPNVVKVVFSVDNRALYFSRSPIPNNRDNEVPENVNKHIGLYAYTKAALNKFVNLQQSSLEKTEKLEQLRLLENNIPIYLSKIDKELISVDTKEDLERVNRIL